MRLGTDCNFWKGAFHASGTIVVGDRPGTTLIDALIYTVARWISELPGKAQRACLYSCGHAPFHLMKSVKTVVLLASIGATGLEWHFQKGHFVRERKHAGSQASGYNPSPAQPCACLSVPRARQGASTGAFPGVESTCALPLQACVHVLYCRVQCALLALTLCIHAALRLHLLVRAAFQL